MTHFFLRLFVKNADQTSDPKVRAAVGTLSGIVGILCNFFLFLGKVIIGTLSGSVSITADAMNNLSDAASSIVTLVGFKLAEQPADAEHPYGHARFEYLSGLVVSAMIVIIGFELAKTSVGKILSPVPVVFSAPLAAVLVLSIAVKLWLCLFNRTLGRKINSTTLLATSEDSRNDIITTAAVLLAAVIEAVSGLSIDGFVGLAVSLFILYSGAKLAKETISPLLGQPPEKEFVDRIESIVLSHPAILGLHDLVVHDYGPGRVMVSLHAEVPAHGDLLELHDIVDNIEMDLSRQLNCQAVIHMDPVVTDDGLTGPLRSRVAELVKQVDPAITIHDFRVVAGPTHTNLVFDAVVPFDEKLTAAQAADKIRALVRSMDDGRYFAVVKVENSYIG